MILCTRFLTILPFFVQKRLEDEVEKKQKNVRRLEISLKKLTEELAKGNEIIQKLQNDVKSYHEKVSGLSARDEHSSKFVQLKRRNLRLPGQACVGHSRAHQCLLFG